MAAPTASTPIDGDHDDGYGRTIGIGASSARECVAPDRYDPAWALAKRPSTLKDPLVKTGSVQREAPRHRAIVRGLGQRFRSGSSGHLRCIGLPLISFEGCAHHLRRAAQPRLHRPEQDRQVLRRLGQRQTEVVMQDDDGALLW